MPSDSNDRTTYNSDGETIDEVVLSNAWVHLEQLDDSAYMLIVENAKTHIHLQMFARPKSKAIVRVLEEFPQDHPERFTGPTAADAGLRALVTPAIVKVLTKHGLISMGLMAENTLAGETRGTTKEFVRELVGAIEAALNSDKIEGASG